MRLNFILRSSLWHVRGKNKTQLAEFYWKKYLKSC